MGRSVVGSLVLHGILFLVILLAPSENETTPHKFSSGKKKVAVKSYSEAEYNERLKQALESKQMQIVQSDEQLKSEKAPDPKKQKTFLSKHNQVVDRNTRAKRVGKFKNVLKEGLFADNKKSAHAKQKKPSVKNLFKLVDDSIPKRELASLSPTTRSPASIGPMNRGKLGDGFSATDDYLEDVAIGANTLLNTYEFKYFSFYSRIRDQVADLWKGEVRSLFPKLVDRGEIIGRSVKKTLLSITLSNEGKVLDAKLKGSSGIEDLDGIAVNSFKQASPYPHPPRELIDKNGRVSIDWSFVVVSDGGSQYSVKVKRGRYR